ncbi:hypothetical protein O181_108786 [Austropuccinia psidii MF-1]|uniref:Uncharacterized protein n=1 Tax=Austropuccinia psidii MF-1 TaxID=1389203 RepID=A0A9Q3JVG0_9BASI|nr:hypothetical protein [Austropuccinia psidii MF-1]
MLADKHSRNACLLSAPSNNARRGAPNQDTLTRTPLWSTIMKVFASWNGVPDPKLADRNASGQLAWFLQVSTCPPPLLGHHPMVTLLLDWRKVIIWPIKDGNGKRRFKLRPIFSMSCHPWDSNSKVKQNQLNPLQQDSPIPSLPCRQTPRQLTPGLSGNQWLEASFHEYSQPNEPPIPGPSPSSEPHEDPTTRKPKHEVSPTLWYSTPIIPVLSLPNNQKK